MDIFVRQVLVLTAGVFVSTCEGNSTRFQLPWTNEELSPLDYIALPPHNGLNVTEVEVALLVNSFGTVSEETMQISLEVVTRQQWVDPRLKFNPYINGQYIKRAELSDDFATKIWRPSLYFENEKAGTIQSNGVMDQLAHVYSNGSVLYSKRMSLVLNCPMALYRYPHDSQHCPIRVSSFAYTSDVVLFHWKKFQPVIFNPAIHLSRFTFDSQPATTNCTATFTVVGDFTCLQTHIHLKREFGYYLLQIYLPTMLIVVVSWLSFYLPVDAVPARVSVGLITVLTLTTESTKARSSLPHVSYVTAIDLWMSVSMMFVFAAMLEYAVVCIVHRRSKRPVDSVPGEENATTMPTSYDLQDKSPSDSTVVVKLTSNTYAVLSDKRIDVACRIAFPTAYLIYQIAYWLYYILE